MTTFAASVVAGILALLLVEDAWMTRDAIKRSGGRIVEGNRLAKWFMENDARAAGLVVVELAALLFAVHILNGMGLWFGSLALCLPNTVMRMIVVVKNYRLNIMVM